jgi:hypothetical protein
LLIVAYGAVARRGTHSFRRRERRAINVKYKLSHAVIIAQINEQQSTMVALAVNPARKANSFADMVQAKFGTGM